MDQRSVRGPASSSKNLACFWQGKSICPVEQQPQPCSRVRFASYGCLEMRERGSAGLRSKYETAVTEGSSLEAICKCRKNKDYVLLDRPTSYVTVAQARRAPLGGSAAAAVQLSLLSGMQAAFKPSELRRVAANQVAVSEQRCAQRMALCASGDFDLWCGAMLQDLCWLPGIPK